MILLNRLSILTGRLSHNKKKLSNIIMFKSLFSCQRRARDSNPQPLAGQLISNQPPHQFGYPPGLILFSSDEQFVKPLDCALNRKNSQSESLNSDSCVQKFTEGTH